MFSLNKIPTFIRSHLHFLLSSQVSVLDTGDVCMELLKCLGGQERVKEVLRISCDGTMVRTLALLFLCNNLTQQRLVG